MYSSCETVRIKLEFKDRFISLDKVPVTPVLSFTRILKMCPESHHETFHCLFIQHLHTFTIFIHTITIFIQMALI